MTTTTILDPHVLADRVAARIEQEPRRFYMGRWRGDVAGENMSTVLPDPPCGTTLCVAGWAVEESPDVEWVYPLGALRDVPRIVSDTGAVVPLVAVWVDGIDLEGDEPSGTVDGRPYAVPWIAAAVLLGITDEQSGRLFFEEWDVADVRPELHRAQGRA